MVKKEFLGVFGVKGGFNKACGQDLWTKDLLWDVKHD